MSTLSVYLRFFCLIIVAGAMRLRKYTAYRRRFLGMLITQEVTVGQIGMYMFEAKLRYGGNKKKKKQKN